MRLPSSLELTSTADVLLHCLSSWDNRATDSFRNYLERILGSFRKYGTNMTRDSFYKMEAEVHALSHSTKGMTGVEIDSIQEFLEKFDEEVAKAKATF